MEFISCPICDIQLNDQFNYPVIFKICGHSICRCCLNKIAEQNTFGSLLKIQCPNCRQTQFLDKKKTTLDKEFPKNYLFIQNYSSKKYPCLHVDCSQDFVCVDSFCTEDKPFCFNCARKNHPNCQLNAVFKKKKFKEVVKFESLEVEKWLGVEKMKKEVERKLGTIRDKIFSFIEEIQMILKNENDLIEKSASDQQFYWLHKQIFVNNCEDSPKISLTLKNRDKIQKLIKHVESNLTVGLFEKMDGCLDEWVNHTIIDNIDSLISMNGDVFSSSSSIIENISKMDSIVAKNQIFHNFKIGEIFTFEKYFNLTDIHFNKNKISFNEVSSHNFNEELKYFTDISVSKAFKSDKLTLDSLKHSIENDFTHRFGGVWDVTLTVGFYFAREIPNRKYIHLSRNNWHLVIKEIENGTIRSRLLNPFGVDIDHRLENLFDPVVTRAIDEDDYGEFTQEFVDSEIYPDDE